MNTLPATFINKELENFNVRTTHSILYGMDDG